MPHEDIDEIICMQAPGRFQHICRAAEVKSEATDTEKHEGGTAKGTVFEVNAVITHVTHS